MMRDKIVIYGIGSLGEKIFEYNKRDCLYDIVGFVDDKQNLDPFYCGLPTMNYSQFKENYTTEKCKVFVAIGYVKCSYYRELVIKRLVSDGYELINYISPNSICWEGTIKGYNIFVADNVFVGHGSNIHNGVIIYEGCTFSHDAEIEDFCFVSLRCAMGGYTKVGHNSFIGLNSTVKDSIAIGAYNIVGCGTNVIHSSNDNSVIKGNPGISCIKNTSAMKV